MNSNYSNSRIAREPISIPDSISLSLTKMALFSQGSISETLKVHSSVSFNYDKENNTLAFLLTALKKPRH